MIEPYYQKDGITIYHGDCREILPELAFDCIVTDPPYGMNYKPASVHQINIEFDPVEGDSVDFNPSFLIDWNVNTALCGANFYANRLPNSGGWLCWDKRTRDGLRVRSSECEFVWTNFVHSPKVFRFMWSGAFREGEGRGLHVHPTQKPVEFMAWILKMTKGVVIDPFVGSGTTLRAAKDLGRQAIGIEIEERYCEIAANRLAQGVLNFV